MHVHIDIPNGFLTNLNVKGLQKSQYNVEQGRGKTCNAWKNNPGQLPSNGHIRSFTDAYH